MQKFADVVRRADRRASAPSRASWRPRVTTERRELVERIWSRDPTVWTGKDEAPLARLARRAVAHARGRRPAARRSPTTSRARSTTSCCSGWAARRSRPRCCGAPSAASASTCSTRRTRRRSASSRRGSTSSARSSSRRSKSGSTLETRSHTDYFWKLAPRGEQWVAITDPGSALEQLAREREFRADLPGRADDRRPLLGALAVRARAGGAARRRPAAAARPRAARWPRRAGSTRATRASSSGSRSAQGWQRRAATRSASRTPHGFGLWVEQLSPSRPARRARASCPRPASRPTGPTGRRRRCGSPRRTSSARSSSAGSSRRGRRLDPRHQPVRPARRAGGEGPDERGARGRRRRARAPRARSRSCSRSARGRATTSASRRSSTRPPAAERATRAARRRAPASATGCVVTHGFGPRYLHSTGQLHKGGPNTGVFLQVVEDYGEELPIPGQPFGFGRLIRAQAAGDFESLRERGRRVAPRPPGESARCSSG